MDVDDRYYLQGKVPVRSFDVYSLSLSLLLHAEESLEVDSDDDYPYDEVASNL